MDDSHIFQDTYVYIISIVTFLEENYNKWA